MLGNLIANAVRYTQHGRILITARNRGAHVRIEVWDTGIGIEDDHLPHLFHEFYQADNPERNAAKGLGLGLAIVARLGELLDHRIGVSSKPGRGSVFSVTVPKAMPAVDDTRSETPAPPSRIAVRMTDLAQCQEIGRLLQGWGYEPQCACADDELSLLIASRPVVLICDAACLDQVGVALRSLAQAPQLILIGGNEKNPLGESPIAGRLTMPLRPARLRALVHHLLHEQADEAPAIHGARTASTG